MNITVGARTSPLSRVQVNEVLNELQMFHSEVIFLITWLQSTGDIDQETSLRSLGKTDFFTKEVDRLIIEQKCRIGIHSAKDLADPLTLGLKIVAVTRGTDSTDVLVLPEGCTLASLPKGATIATSSEHRETNVRKLRSDLSFVDIRGTISQRLDKMTSGAVDGVVVAKAALLRLGYYLNEIVLPGTTTCLQGQLAVVAHCEDQEMAALFSCIDCGDR